MFSKMFPALLLLLVAVQFLSADNIFNSGYDCKEKIEEQRDVMAAIQSQMSHLMKQNAQLSSQISELKAENVEQQASLRQLTGTYVSFTVAVVNDNIDIAAGQVVPYTQVVRDYGGGYNTENSTFVCPVSGYYIFMVTVLQLDGGNIDVRLYLDGEGMSRTSSDDPTDQSSGSSQVVSLCTAGQSVWVQAAADSTTSNKAHSNIFSGTLLRIV